MSSSGSAELVVIDDDPADLLLLREILDRGEVVGMSMRQSDSLMGGEALIGDETLCILLDNVLPDGLGMDVIERIREKWPNVALIMMTGSGDEMTSVEALKKGADDYLPKSHMTPSRLADTILAAVDKKKLARAMRTKNDQLALLAHLMDSAEDMLFVVDAAQEIIVRANAATRRALGLDDEDGASFAAPVSRLFSSGYAAWFALKDLLNRGSPARFESTINSHGYLGRPVEIVARLVFVAGTQYVVGVARDISAQKRLQADLMESASIDPQTELPTLNALMLQLKARQASAAEPDQSWLMIAIGTLASNRSQTAMESYWRVRVAKVLSEFSDLHNGHPGVLGPDEFVVAIPEVEADQTPARLAGLRAELDRVVAQASDELTQGAKVGLSAIRIPLSNITESDVPESLNRALMAQGARRSPVPIVRNRNNGDGHL